jgi:hypothetical protein
VTPSKSTVGLLIGTSVDDATFSGYQEVSQSITAAVQFKIECHRFRALELWWCRTAAPSFFRGRIGSAQR